MSAAAIDALLRQRRASLRLVGEDLVIQGPRAALKDSELLSLIRASKAALVAQLRTGGVLGAGDDTIEVPPNLIGAHCERVTPELLPLAQLSQSDIDSVVANIPGGVRNIQDIYGLAPLQEGILFHHLLEEEGDPYLVSTLLSFADRQKLDAYVEALNAVIERHDILRSAVFWEGISEPVQVVCRQARLKVEEVTCDSHAVDVAAELAERFHSRRTRIDVTRAPMMRMYAAYDPIHHRWIGLRLQHHLGTDHRTEEVLHEEIRAFLVGRAARLPTPIAFRTFVAQVRRRTAVDRGAEFFREMLADVDEPTIPFGLKEVRGATEVVQYRLDLDPDLAATVRRCAQRLRVGPSSLFHVAWARVLSCASGQPNPVFGTVMFGRMFGDETTARVLGPFINTLPVKIRLSGTGVELCVRRTHELLAQLLAYEQAPLAEVQQYSNVPADRPLFATLFNYRHSRQPSAQELAEATREGIELIRIEDHTHFPVTLSVDDWGDGFSLQAQVVPTVGAQRLCSMMLVTLGQLANALERQPAAPVSLLEVLPAEERERLLVRWNEVTNYAHETCVHELFEDQVRRAPDALAVIDIDRQLTYRDLNARANRLARLLSSLGVGVETRVAVCMDRGFELVVGILGIWKAGGAYVPLDPGHPPERLSFMVRDSGATVLLTESSLLAPLSSARADNPDVRVVVIDHDDVRATLAKQPDITGPARFGLMPRHLAYVIYTSGSTGQPKGVMVEHANVARLLFATQEHFHFNADDVWTLFHSFAFDFSVWEIWGALAYGGRLVIVPHLVSRSPADFFELVCREGVTVLNQTPSAFRQLIVAQAQSGQCHGLRVVIFGGEALELQTLKPWYERETNRCTQLINMYGITEITVHATYCPLDPSAGLSGSPIGRRLSDSRFYILDAGRQPVPIGASGEIYIGGAGVARGYLSRPELTGERFIASPFVPGDRLYKTGDLARYRPDGSIEFLGRNDFQVKIRGFRIEVGEIELRLLEQPGVREAVVVTREDASGDKRLVAYVVAQTHETVEEMRARLRMVLPEYMVPSAVVRLQELPLTVNGKLDRKGLPAPDDDSYARSTYEVPHPGVESTIAAIWSEVLKVARVGRHDNFFAMGGHSLLAMRVLERMRREGLAVDVKTLFLSATPAELGKVAGRASAVSEVPPNLITPGCRRITPEMLPLVQLNQEDIDRIVAGVPGGVDNVQDIYGLAPLQEGMLFHHVMGRQRDPYLLLTVLAFKDRSTLAACLAALNAVIARHDILRTSVLWEGLSEPVQVVWRQASLPVQELDLDPADGDIATQLRERFHPRRHRLDITRAPMMRLYVAHDPVNERWVGVELIHHLVDDNTTAKLVDREIYAHLEGSSAQLPAVLPFRNYIAYIRRALTRKDHEPFFRRMLEDLEQPTAPFGQMQILGDGSEIFQTTRRLDTRLSKRVHRCAQALGVGASSLFHVAWAQLLSRASGDADPVFGTVVFGRMHGSEGVDRVMGPFINTLPLRVRLRDVGVEECVRGTHGVLAQLLTYEHVPLAEMQQYSQIPAGLPLIVALINYHHGFDPEGLQYTVPRGAQRLDSEGRTNYPITLSIDDQGGEFEVAAQAPAEVGAQRLCDMVLVALEGLVSALECSPGRRVSELEVLTAEERERLLAAWSGTMVEYPTGGCIHELFERQVAATPQAIAITYLEDSLTYAELNARANRLAYYLRSLGVAPDQTVAVCAERRPEFFVAVLAILKAGGAFVPLDPAYPVERLAYMLRDSAPVVILSDEMAAGVLRTTGSSLPTIGLSIDSHRWHDQPDVNLDPQSTGLSSRALAYIIYTSGSTGRPKGVMIEHEGVCNLAAMQTRLMQVNQRSRVLQFASLSFDACVSEWAMAFSTGACLCLAPREKLIPGDPLVSTLKEQGITVVTLPPTALDAIPARERGIVPGTLIVAGEACPGSLVHIWAPGRRFINAYGPTEVTVCATMHVCDAQENGQPPIGRPMGNTRLYILDAQQRPVPIGVTGEIYVGGVGVARGYLNRPDLTQEHFLPSPFVVGDRLYRTGDLARFRENGYIEYQGRNDTQVKIRGYRIEPGEIETRLRAHQAVHEAVVIAREDTPGDQRLVAYYTAEAGAEISAEELRTYLSRALASYMVPAAYVRLASLPLTPNGKVARKALPSPDAEAYASHGYEAPQGDVETTLARIWCEVLKVARVGRHDDFFELGGHSLLAMRALARMRSEGLQVDVKTLFLTPTISGLAAVAGHSNTLMEAPPNLISPECDRIRADMLPLVDLNQTEIDRIVATVPGGVRNVQDIYPLAPLQAGILFHYLMARAGDPYLSRTLMSFPDRGCLERYAHALNVVIARHDILRTAVLWEGLSKPVQVVWRAAGLDIETLPSDAPGGDVIERLESHFHAGGWRLDITRAPLMRLVAAPDPARGRWVALHLFHHLALDQTTAEIMNSEVRLQLAGRLPPHSSSPPFRRFVAHVGHALRHDEHEAFFRQMLADVRDTTAPFGLTEVYGDGTRNVEAGLRLDATLSNRLRTRARLLGVSVASLFHLATAVLLARVS